MRHGIIWQSNPIVGLVLNGYIRLSVRLPIYRQLRLCLWCRMCPSDGWRRLSFWEVRLSILLRHCRLKKGIRLAPFHWYILLQGDRSGSLSHLGLDLSMMHICQHWAEAAPVSL